MVAGFQRSGEETRAPRRGQDLWLSEGRSYRLRPDSFGEQTTHSAVSSEPRPWRTEERNVERNMARTQ